MVGRTSLLGVILAVGQAAGRPSISPVKDESEQDPPGQHISKNRAGPGIVPLAPTAGGDQALTPVMQDAFNGGLQPQEGQEAWSRQCRPGGVQHAQGRTHFVPYAPEMKDALHGGLQHKHGRCSPRIELSCNTAHDLRVRESVTS